MADDVDDEIDWKPPSHWLESGDETRFQEILLIRYCFGSGYEGWAAERAKAAELVQWREWRADPEAYRKARVDREREYRSDLLKPRSHAIAYRLLSLPDLPLVFEDDGIDTVVRSVWHDEDGSVGRYATSCICIDAQNELEGPTDVVDGMEMAWHDGAGAAVACVEEEAASAVSIGMREYAVVLRALAREMRLKFDLPPPEDETDE